MDFNDFYWHDSVLLNIYIDRKEPGENDSVVMDIDWYDTPRSRIKFNDVYLFKANMNFGIVAPESIDMAYIELDSEDLLNFYKKWNGHYDEVKLNCYVIKTSSTGSEIKIIASDFELIDI